MASNSARRPSPGLMHPCVVSPSDVEHLPLTYLHMGQAPMASPQLAPSCTTWVSEIRPMLARKP
eukprot:c29605_g1_i1 orf=90-281(-)